MSEFLAYFFMSNSKFMEDKKTRKNCCL